MNSPNNSDEPRMSTRIFVVDDNEWIRRGVLEILRSSQKLEVCGEAKDGADAIQQAQKLVPDLILLDISMPGMNGLEVTRVLRQKLPNTKILIMSQNDREQVLPSALEAGAQGCIDKNHLAMELVPAIENIIGDIDPRS